MAQNRDAPKGCRWLLLEIGVSVVVSALFLTSCIYGPRFNVIDRVGQVSALALVELRLLCFAIPMIVALLLAARLRGGRHFELVSRLTCAAFAGLASATIAGGLAIVLRGTPYGLGANIGDSSVLAEWSQNLRDGREVPALYPPLQVHFLAWFADLYGTSTTYAIKPFQIFGVLLVGPAAYASWRLLLQPRWALGIGVLAALPFIDVYRPYPFLVLVVFIPVALRFLQLLRRSPDLTLGELLRNGVGIGVCLGILCLVYSGWMMWSFGGFAVAAAIVFPWKRGWRAGAILIAAAALPFAVITVRYFLGVLDTLPVEDRWMYFESRVEPAYIAMWRGDLPGVVEKLELWPPAGEMAGVGVFTLLLVVGIGVAVALGRHRTVVIGVGAMMTGIWLLRFWHAHRMWKTRLVQLYPRTTAELLYCSLILCGFAAYFYVQRARKRAPADSPLHSTAGPIGATCAVLLLLVFSTSPTLDRVMPKEGVREYGNLAWLAHKTPRPSQQDLAIGATVEASTSLEEKFSKAGAVDGSLATVYSSKLHDTADHEEWVVVRWPEPKAFSRVVIVSAVDGGFPVDFTIDIWDGKRWLTRLTRRGYSPTYAAEIFTWNQTEKVEAVRLRATKLGAAIPDAPEPTYALRLRELELYW